MAENKEQGQETVFQLDNKYVVKAWDIVNYRNKKPSVSIEKVQIFLKQVFENSKNEMDLELEDDIDYMEMVLAFLQENDINDKKTFTLQQALKVLNWAVDPTDKEEVEEQGQQDKQLQQKKKQQPSYHQLQNQQPEQTEPEQPEDQHDWGKVDPQEENNQKLYKEINSYQEKSIIDDQVVQEVPVNQESSSHDQQVHKLQAEQQQPPIRTLKKYYKQPLSIKKSLAQLNKSKAHQKPKDLPIIKLDPASPQIKYLKKQKITLKNKKAKLPYHPEHMGLQQLFKFYCGLNSEYYSMSKHKDPAKGTFDEFQSRMNNLYMHNFMLLCKDFNISQCKRTSKAGLKNSINENVKENKTNQKSPEQPVKRRSSKGSVPQSVQGSFQLNKSGVHVEISHKEKQLALGKKYKLEGKKDIWDRDNLSNYFKRQADYTLNVKYIKFIQIMKTVLQDKLIIQEEQKQQQQAQKQPMAERQVQKKPVQKNTKIQQDEQDQVPQGQISETEKTEEQEQAEQVQKDPTVYSQSNSKTIQVDPIIMAICKFFKLDTEQNYESTITRLRAQYKINCPLPTPKIEQPKKSLIEQPHSHFQQDIDQALKARQIQKEQQRIQIKQKYLNKYAIPELDVYSSFKTATNPVNSLNSMYGSAPKLIPNKQGKCSTVSEGNFGANNFEYEVKKKHSGEYKVSMASIIREARNEIKDASKENWQSNRMRENLNGQTLAKSRLSCINNSQNSPKQTLGYKKLHDLRQLRQQEQTLSSILLNKSRLLDGGNTSRSQKAKHKSKDISSPLLQRMGCHEEDDLLNKYFDQEKHLDKSNVRLAAHLR